MSSTSTRYCHLHPDRETLRSCSRCDRPTCGQCLRDAPVGQHCVACLKEAAGPASARVKRQTVANARQIKAMDMPVTRVVIAINAAVFVMTEIVQRISTDSLAVFATDPQGIENGVADGAVWRLLTAGFIHYGALHIAFNMYALWIIGRMLEPALGTWRYIGLYVVSLLGGSLGALVMDPQGFTGGASGAVFGLAAAGTVALRRRGVPFNATWGPMLVINFVLTFAIPGISIGGHVGGAVFGAIVGATVMSPRRRGARFDAAVLVGLGAFAVLASIAIAHSPIR